MSNFFELSLSFILSLSHYMSFKHNCSRNWHSFDSFLPNVFRDFSYLTDVRKNIFILDMEISLSLLLFIFFSLFYFFSVNLTKLCFNLIVMSAMHYLLDVLIICQHVH